MKTQEMPQKRQSIVRLPRDKNNPYVTVNKGYVNDFKLSLKAKGLMTYLLSLPSDWMIYKEEITMHHKDGRDSVTSGFKELLRAGYMTHVVEKNSKGQFVANIYTVYEQPQIKTAGAVK